MDETIDEDVQKLVTECLRQMKEKNCIAPAFLAALIDQARASALETFLNSTELFLIIAKALHKSRYGHGLVWDIDRGIKYQPSVKAEVRACREKALSEARNIRNSILKEVYGYKKAREMRGDKLGKD